MIGTASVVLDDDRIAGFAIRDLSATGAMLVGPCAIPKGASIDVMLEADGDRMTGIQLRGRVARTHALGDGRYAIGVAFRDLTAAIHDHLQELVTDILERQRAAAPPAIMIVDQAPDALRAVTRDVGDHTHEVVGATTLLELVQLVHDPRRRIEAALVNARVGDANGLAILEYLQEDHPMIRRVLMSERSRNYEGEVLSGRAHAFIAKPWERECLMSALFA